MDQKYNQYKSYLISSVWLLLNFLFDTKLLDMVEDFFLFGFKLFVGWFSFEEGVLLLELLGLNGDLWRMRSLWSCYFGYTADAINWFLAHLNKIKGTFWEKEGMDSLIRLVPLRMGSYDLGFIVRSAASLIFMNSNICICSYSSYRCLSSQYSSSWIASCRLLK